VLQYFKEAIVAATSISFNSLLKMDYISHIHTIFL